MKAILATLDAKTIEVLKYDWRLFARDKQLAPVGDWRTWVPLAGRGWGKTRTGSEWIREQVEGPTPLSRGKRQRIALIAETAADVRDVMINGDSGILQCSPKDYRPIYVANRRALVWPNGTEALLFSAIQPDQLRGPQFDCAWCDELAKWRYAQDTWDMLQMGLRLGDNPQSLVTTTPRNIQVLKDILADPSTVHTKGTTYENAGNLAGSFADYIKRKYEGTRLGRQELLADILSDVPGALWPRALLDRYRIRPDEEGKVHTPEFNRIVVSIDPPTTSGEASDSCGMVVAGSIGDVAANLGHAYVLGDYTAQGLTPNEWAKQAVKLFHEYKANAIIAETNQGGEMVSTIIHHVDPNVPVHRVHASHGKFARAEPVAAIYEQGRVHHVGTFTDLEDEMCNFTITGLPDPSKSPDRVDALVWAINGLLIQPADERSVLDAL